MTTPSPTPDVRQLEREDLPRIEFPVSLKQEFRIVVDESAHASILRHAAQDKSVEICGVLVGRLGQDENGPFVDVMQHIRGDQADNQFAEVTFTHESWAKINQEMDTKYVDLQIVGWYHSHPDFGIFLSDRDCFIQQHFFSNPGQVALVVDPVRATEGVFVWKNGKPEVHESYWVGDRLRLSSTQPDEKPQLAESLRQAVTRPADSSAMSEGSWYDLTRWALPILLAFLVGFFAASRQTTWERSRIIEGVVAHYGIWKGLRPDLRPALDTVSNKIGEVIKALEPLSPDRSKDAKDANAANEADAAKWKDALATLAVVRDFVTVIQDRFCLSDEETQAVEKVILAKQAALQKSLGQSAAPEKSTNSASAKKANTAGTDRSAAASNKKAASAPAKKVVLSSGEETRPAPAKKQESSSVTKPAKTPAVDVVAPATNKEGDTPPSESERSSASTASPEANIATQPAKPTK